LNPAELFEIATVVGFLVRKGRGSNPRFLPILNVQEKVVQKMLSSSESLDAMRSALESTDLLRRRDAICKVAQNSRQQSGLTSAIISLVTDKDEEVRNWACEALETVIVPMPNEVLSLITLLRETNDGEIEYWTATMLGRLGPVAANATAVLASCLLDSRSLAARERAAWALSEIGPAARSAMNALRQIGSDDPPRLQRLAASAIQSLMGRAA
jgi:hypothetical protein